ncbi:hypothetical protein CEUSTIGMA_g9768.t1 [Chlamydomonas eustigma]|uniref:Transmembrane protein 230 n=1 Tax=Chlamydomonas eustigma TaxID=1157962 RepID=A0A250XHE4_9CHLO|nr:hypothetical protein CEUSTIGMA_g9768.t1 [Chlamydomonas eustigma]|eukprot:GAX82339.1 hypothetical protein CEUSTIGMA_g9768.t1 [Chlamydomonas eustigma]
MPASSPESANNRPGERSNLLNEYRLSPDVEEGLHFGLEAPRKPWKKIALAVSLLVFGCLLLFLGVGFRVTGQKNGIPLIVVGCFAFIPGAYYTWFAFKAWKGTRGYSINSIPDM